MRSFSTFSLTIIYNISLRRAPSPNITFLARAQKSCRIRLSSLRALLPFLIFLFLSHFFSLLPSLPPSSTQPPLSPVVHIPDTRRECQITSQQPRSLLLVISLENLRGIFLSFHHLHSSMVSPSCRVCCLFFPTCHWSCTLPNTLRVRS